MATQPRPPRPSQPPRNLLSNRWTAQWIAPAGAAPQGFGVYHFRRAFQLDTLPPAFLVHVSGDSRYELFCNGHRLCSGPARGDLNHWRYESVDLRPHLRPGRNVLAAVVWNDGEHAALCQWSERTAFLLQADLAAHDPLVNTGPEWRFFANPAYQPIPVPTYQLTGYYAIGPCERFDAARHPWNWQSPDFDDLAWPPVETLRHAAPRAAQDSPSRWMLVPRPIPPMAEAPVRFASIMSAGAHQPAPAFLQGKAPLTIPPNTRTEILLSQGYLTCAFPELDFDRGAGARIHLDYTEALFEELKPRRRKGNRGVTQGKTFIGYGDVVLPDGRPRSWRPLYWRTFMYLRLTVETAAEPLVLNDIRSLETSYPFQLNARFESGVELHQRIIDTGFRTALRCAHETYMDCPYYEQLQYVGDTRIQALVSLYASGDARLMRNAIEQIDSSRTAEGATLSRAPSVLQQYIPPFSLWWIGMLHDYWRYVDDPGFVREMMPGVRAILAFYERYERPDGLLGEMPWWNYVDWVDSWRSGRPPSEPGLMPASIQLQWLLAFQYARDLERGAGRPAEARRCAERENQLKTRIQTTFWDEKQRLYTEDSAHRHPSQHANVLAVLAGLPAPARDLMERVEADKKMAQCSVYFRYYLDRAMVAAGLGDRYLERLGTWEFMLAEGLTTWAEKDDPFTRSDCHAWGASPNVEFLRTVLGVDSAAPGFTRVQVKPHLGPLREVRGVVPHPKGMIRVQVRRTAQGLDVQVQTPPGVPFDIIR